MFKKIILVATVVLLIGVAIASAYPWESQKKNANVFKRNLAGTAPTAIELATNFVLVGDFVIDTSNSDTYQVINRTVPLFVKVASNGTLTVTTVAADKSYVLNSAVTITNDIVYGTISGGTGTAVRLNFTTLYGGGNAGLTRAITNLTTGNSNLVQYLYNGIVTNFAITAP